MKEEWDELELITLKELDFSVYGGYSKKRDITFLKEISYNRIMYSVGIESTAYDVDGDLGYCRSWRSFKSFEEAIEFIKNK